MAVDVFKIVGTLQAGAFQVEEVVAEGGFAVVYRARHQAFRADVALKCLKLPGHLAPAQQASFLEKFREEAELLFRLSANIPSVVRPLQVGTLDPGDGSFVPFIALEWLDGTSLGDLIEKRREQGKPPLRLEQLVPLLAPVAHGLALAHRFPGAQGPMAVLHRDLKPDNLFIVDFHGQKIAKILDFGIGKTKSAASQVAGKLSAQATAIQAFTPSYGAPEQWLPKRYGQTGAWTDVWGLAITIVEVVCGHTPLDGDAAAIMGSAIDEVRRPTPRNEGVAVSDAVEQVFAKALAVDPRNRYHDMDVFWSDLEAAVGVVGPKPAQASSTLESVRPAPPAYVRSSPAAATVRAPASRRDAPPPSSLGGHVLDADDLGGGGGRSLELDGIGLMPSSATPRAPPRRGTSVAATHGIIRPRRPLSARVALPLRMIVFAVALMAAQFGYARVTGETLAFGPVRPFWIAGPLAGLAVIMIALAVFSSED